MDFTVAVAMTHTIVFLAVILAAFIKGKGQIFGDAPRGTGTVKVYLHANIRRKNSNQIERNKKRNLHKSLKSSNNKK